MEVSQPNNPVLDRFFEHYYRRRPVNATFTGMHKYDSLLPDWSPDGLAATTAEMVALREQLSLDIRAHVDSEGFIVSDEPTDIDCALADAFLEIQIAEYEGFHFQRGNPALFSGEAVFSIISLMLREFAPANDRVTALEQRLLGIQDFLAKAHRSIDGRPVPSSWTTRALDECDGAVHLLGNGISKWCQAHHLDKNTVAALERAAQRAQTAFVGFRSWLETRPEAPAEASGSGPDFFDLVLRRGHWDFRSREDLLKEVQERFEEAEHKLDEMAARMDPGGWEAVSTRLGAIHPNADEYLDAFDTTWRACKDLAEKRDLVTWPDFPIRYVQIPDWARKAAPHLYFLNYRSPAPYDGLEVLDYLVPPIDLEANDETLEAFLRGVNDSVIKLNHVVHHGALGHHVQNFNAIRSESRIGQIAAVDCASRIGMFCGGSLAEGWACYATDVMGEVGFQTDLELVAEQHSRLRQLARAIVDIELHQHSWTEADASQFYQERIGMSAGAAAREVTRNSMFPGASIMYWLGTQGIHDLRSTLTSRGGSDFSLRSFHDKFLSYGSIPVLLIARLMAGNFPS
jgi:hypothetical protein